MLLRILFALLLFSIPIEVSGQPKPTPKVEVAIATVEKAEIPLSTSKPAFVNPSLAPKKTPAFTGSVPDLIRQYSALYGIDASLPLRIANCESGFDTTAKNPASTASGVFQYLSGTWSNTPEGRAGLSVFDAEANVRAAVRHIAVHHDTSPWNSSKPCWQ